MTVETSVPGGLRIGALSKRAGVSEHVLRAWESRYGLLSPTRSSGGFRLYSETDVRRVQRMRAYLADGLSAAEAARAVLAEPAAAAPPPQDPVVVRLAETNGPVSLRSALDLLDERAAHVVLDQLFGALTVEAVIRDVLIPYLHELGDRWSRGDVTVGQEHFASNVIRSRLAALSPGWGGGRGPQVLLACPPGELHDIALLSFGLVLRRSGWRVVFLGADSPTGDIERTADALEPDLVMLAASDASRFDAIRPELVRLAQSRPVALAGPGASAELAAAVGAQYVDDDPVTAAERLEESR
ncbi:cobalamin B12-binding domain-containing protein [Kribbella speibonae]|uniref:Cobalamin B12-binding domain-containing protein n=1 Tax=Kribbella speibonae TaxID=1572660 RepID=A0A4R0INK5_9ACTN|nr:cobalamin B12-binding domain-containing protein [Kribbella speibonae]TCC34020.1 cobalamin B12-binding domain-containing protein [Kribbella speibonae]